MDTLTVVTNNHKWPVLDASELSDTEAAEFDYLDWSALREGTDSASFFRYKGMVYDLGEFMTTRMLPEFNALRAWHGYLSDSFFSGIVVRYSEDTDYLVVGRFYS